MHTDQSLKNEIKKKGCLIINLDRSDGGGTHWVSCITNKGKFYYLDSFGFEPPEVVTLATKSFKNRYYFQNSIQSTKSFRCGFYCILFCKALTGVTQKDKLEDTYDKIFNSWDTVLENNDQKLLDLLESYYKSGKGIIDNAIDALPFELHMPQQDTKTGQIKTASFIGPGTQIFRGKTRLNPDGSIKSFSQPVTPLDEAAYRHDLAYHYDGPDKLQVRRKADRNLSLEANEVIQNPKTTPFNRVTANIVKFIMDKLQST